MQLVLLFDGFELIHVHVQSLQLRYIEPIALYLSWLTCWVGCTLRTTTATAMANLQGNESWQNQLVI